MALCHRAIGAFFVILTASASTRADDPPAPQPASPPPARPGEGREGRPPEALEMFWSIVTQGANMGPGTGWFHPGQSRYGWTWLARRFDRDGDGAIVADEFDGPAPWFSRLDRDRDGSITGPDLDWSERSEYLRQRAPFRAKFSQADANSNGRVSREEFLALFERQAGEKGFLTPDDVADLFAPPQRPRASSSSGPPPDMPSRATLLKGFFSGEIGSMREGPAIDDPAPDFRLKTHDDRFEVALRDFRGHEPVVLIFGSFT